MLLREHFFADSVYSGMKFRLLIILFVIPGFLRAQPLKETAVLVIGGSTGAALVSLSTAQPVNPFLSLSHV